MIHTFHHLGIITHNLAGAVAQYERLGFVFTPLSFPEFPLVPGGTPELVGVANRHMIFRNGYVEMLGVVDPARWSSISVAQRGPYDIDRPLRRYEGLHVMHFGTEDLNEVRVRMVRDGLNPSPIRPFRRTVELPDGSVTLMHARCLSLPPEATPEALFQIVQHETPELVLQPRFMNHPNGASRLSEAILCVEDPAEVAARYASYAGRPVERRGNLYCIELGEGRLVVLDRANLTAVLPGETASVLPCLAGFTVTADLDRTGTFLLRQRIPFLRQDGRIVVSARDACGSAVVFTP